MKRTWKSRIKRPKMRIEQLEWRQLMAGLAEIAVQLTRSKVLRINGNDQTDVASITQNDALNHINVRSSKSDGTIAEEIFSANAVNIGYMVAGAMIEHWTGKSFEQLMKTFLFEPLGMASAGIRYSVGPRSDQSACGT